jgi:hypothetical protein
MLFFAALEGDAMKEMKQTIGSKQATDAALVRAGGEPEKRSGA